MLRSLLLLLPLVPAQVLAWGFWAHSRINRYACFTLPKPLFGFYKTHIDFVSDHAVDPDKRRYADPQEAPRHFIDIDRYGSPEAIRMPYNEAVCMFGEDTVLRHGTVPWTVLIFYHRLVRAFGERDVGRVLYYSACIGHYIGDAHVPLHCTSNYNGQLTGQHDIHGFWETRLPELFGEEYELVTDHAVYIPDPAKFIWDVVEQSHAAVDSVLSMERFLDSETRPDRKFYFDDRGSKVVKTYSSDYSESYHALLAGQVERRMRSAAFAVGCYWYSAWLDAGQPYMSLGSIDSAWIETAPDSIKGYSPDRICD